MTTRTIAITSGKGGVGKTCVAANLGAALVKAGRRVLVVDMDLGLANLDIVLNLQPRATLHEVLIGTHTLDDAILEGPGGVRVLAAGSGMADYSRLTSGVREQLPDILRQVSRDYDYLLLDIGAGISEVVLYAASLAQEVLIVATPEPTSMADAYAAMKVMTMQQDRSRFFLVMNQVTKERPGRPLAEQLQRVADRFLREQLGKAVTLSYLGAVPADPAVEHSVCRRQLLMVHAPDTPAAQALAQVATELDLSVPTPVGAKD